MAVHAALSWQRCRVEHHARGDFPESDVPLVGASGAVVGLMAAYLILYPKVRLTMMFVFWQVKLAFWAWMGLYLVVQVLGAILTLPGRF